MPRIPLIPLAHLFVTADTIFRVAECLDVQSLVSLQASCTHLGDAAAGVSYAVSPPLRARPVYRPLQFAVLILTYEL
jgi:hypothetical protein